MILSIKL